MITVLKRFTTTSRSRPQSLHMQPKIMGLRATPTAACIVCDHPLFNQPSTDTDTHPHQGKRRGTPLPTYCTYGRPFNVGIVDYGDDDVE